jgi:hypothetical protein
MFEPGTWWSDFDDIYFDCDELFSLRIQSESLFIRSQDSNPIKLVAEISSRPQFELYW